MMSRNCFYKVLELDFENLLDVGCGPGYHSLKFLTEGQKKVTGIDIQRHHHIDNMGWFESEGVFNFIEDDFMRHKFNQKFECVWASHVLEHQLNVHDFLKKVIDLSSKYIAITVPPRKDQIVGGHVSIWNAGLLLYNLVLAGNNCKNAKIHSYGYNISIIVEKDLINTFGDCDLGFDKGDIEKLSKWLPDGLGEPFDGDIKSLNW